MADFTDEELTLLTTTPSMIGSTIAFSESSGVVGTVTEAMSNAKAVLSGVQSYPQNALIETVAPSIADRKDAMEKAKAVRTNMMARMKEKGITSRDGLRQQVVEDCREVARILDSKADSTEAAQYRAWVMEIAEKVAMSAKEGGFLGFGGERLSEGEKQVIGEVAGALGANNPLTA